MVKFDDMKLISLLGQLRRARSLKHIILGVLTDGYIHKMKYKVHSTTDRATRCIAKRYHNAIKGNPRLFPVLAPQEELSTKMFQTRVACL